jgi:excisionase family DNA binding protein
VNWQGQVEAVNSVGTRSPSAVTAFSSQWLTYVQAAAYTGWSVRYLRNLVSADSIPVFGPPRSRRFRRDLLDLFLTNRDLAMRRFLAERKAHGD